ncbi:MAG: polysaccharide deacetylase family protein [Oscillospiraceae bacterium]|nr:polysaccharide deacetylase family protein [Oscillospiraceae bacterium]
MKKIITAAIFASFLLVTASAKAELTALSDKKVAYGMGVETDPENRPLGAIQAQNQYGDMGTLFIGEAENKRLWLTFDEGYENGCTARILDTLADKNVKAVFFITYDYAEKNPELVRRMIDEGHTVGNHTYSHPSLAECTEEKIYEELSRLHAYVSDNFGYEMYVMRPPKGEFSEKVLAAAKDMGYTTVLWSFAYEDWLTNNQPDETYAFEKITSKTHNGAVYLLHAVSETNTNILSGVIDFWKKSGYLITPM